MASFGAIWELTLLQLNCLSYTHKPVSLDLACRTCYGIIVCQKVRDFCIAVPRHEIWETRPLSLLWIFHRPQTTDPLDWCSKCK